MWKKLTVLTVSLGAVILGTDSCLVAANAGQQTGQTTETSILSTLRTEHPRIIALDEDIRAVKNLIKTHEQGSAWFKTLKDAGEAVIQAPPVEHKLEGPRLLTQSRAALDRITLLGFLHRVQPDPRYVQRAVTEMETACAFPDWNPSHFLDTAEMTAAMAIGYDWFYADLTTETRTRVRNGIVNLGLEAGLKVYNAKPRWLDGHNNWNQVCNGGLIIGALAIADEEPEISARILRHGKKSLTGGMKLFEPDGGWVEAPMYWNYTMKYTSRVLAAMHSALGTAFGLDDGPGFANTGNFILAMEGPTGKYFNWGDCSESAGNLPEMFWLAERFDNPIYAYLGKSHMNGNPEPFDLIWYKDSSASALSTTPLDWYFRDTEAASMRQSWDTNASFVGLKAGDNAAPHSNLDLGTFVFDADGERWVAELGGDNYNMPGYWDKNKRLAYYRINSFGQNVLTFNGMNQGLQAKGNVVKRGSESDSAFAIVDLSEAYADVTSRTERGFSLIEDRRVLIIQDEFETSGPVELMWTMHTKTKAEIQGAKIVLSQGKSSASLTVLEPKDGALFVESAEQTPPQNTNKGVLRLGVKHKHAGGGGRVVVKITPGSVSERDYDIRDLKSW